MANFLNPLTVAPNDITADTYFDAITKHNISSIWLAAQLGLISFDVSIVAGTIRISLKDIEGNSPSISNPIYSFARKNGIPNIFEYTSFIAERSIDIPAINTLGYISPTKDAVGVDTSSDSWPIYIYLFRQDGGTSWNIGVSGMGLGVSASKITYTSQNVTTSGSINGLYTSLSGTPTGTIIPIQSAVVSRNNIQWISANPTGKLSNRFSLPYIQYNIGSGISALSFPSGFDVPCPHNFNDPFARGEVWVSNAGYTWRFNAPVETKIKQNSGTIGGRNTGLITAYNTTSNNITFRLHQDIDSIYSDFVNTDFSLGSQSIVQTNLNFVVWPSVKGF